MYRLLADLLVLLHLAFVAFVVAGGLLAWRWPRVTWVHLPAAVWGAVVEFMGWMCPLTPLENHFRWLAGGEVYTGDFVERYLIPLLYPAALTRAHQLVLGLLVVGINVACYALVWRRHRRRVG